MGINAHGLRLLCYARTLGVDLQRTATIARQRLSLSARTTTQILAAFDRQADHRQVRQFLMGAGGYAEVLLAHLGADEVHSFDISEYEGATHLHDMNEPISESLKNKYSTVMDFGSLEHVFNVPVALKNCMEMVMVGGHYICVLPANNFFGHGFYQFSPEFFYGALSEENGFDLQAVIAFEDVPDWKWESANPGATWYSVESPAKLRERTTLVNSKPLSLAIVAKRVADRPIFATTPQQSDYAARWAEEQCDDVETAVAQRRPIAIRLAKKMLPARLRLVLRALMQPRSNPLGRAFDRRFFKKIDLPTS